MATYYQPVLIFYDEINKNTETYSMSFVESKFYLDVPDTITKVGGNYQIHFVLKERMDSSTEGGYVGAEDDPAYREIFISESCKGAVDSGSGFSLLPQNFN